MIDSAKTGYGFGTFKGVFTPSILTILGVIMYLRFGWVLGNVGLAHTLLIVTMATAITFLTGLSLSALATNRRVGGGGAYYIISRSLGLEAGASVGLPLYFAQALGIAFYISGFSEAVAGVFPDLDTKVVGMVTLVTLAGLVYISADLALKTQFIILGIIISSLVVFFAGGRMEEFELASDLVVPDKVAFWAVFAIFFPAVTGIEAGIAMSGDLKDPAKSLPRGTIAAVLVGYVIYMIIPVFLHWAVPDERLLLTESLIMRKVAIWGDLILVGVWCATLSSAMGALLGAPRTLQALARDRVLPRSIGRGYGKGGDPRIAILITFGVAGVGIMAGDLNLIAPILSMFFLTSYGMLNISAGLEEIIGPASWRPTFRIPGWVSLLGAFACFAVMFMINAGATILALSVCAGVFALMKRRSLSVQWGSMKYGILMLAAREMVYRLARLKPDARTWKPNILVFSGAPTKRWYLIQMAAAISQNRAMTTLATVLPKSAWSAEREAALRETIEAYLVKRDIRALVKVVPGDDPLQAAHALVTGYGFGPLVPNTILIGETEKKEHFETYARLTRHIYRTRRNLVIVRESAEESDEGSELHAGDRIDVWWRGKEANVGLMITLSYLIRQSDGWQGARLMVKQIVDDEAEVEPARKALSSYLAEQRVDAEVDIYVKDTPDVFDMIRPLSAGADLVCFGMRPPLDDESLESYANFYKIMLRNTDGLPAVALVLAAQDIEFFKLFSED